MDKYYEINKSQGFHTHSWTNFVIPDSPLGIFHPFFTIEILQFIVEQTNKYALECIGHLLMENDPVYHYAPVASRIS